MTGLDRVLRGATVALVLVFAALGLAFPKLIFYGGVAWLAFLIPMFSGWGYLAIRATKGDDVDFSLRAAWGIAAFLALCGPFLAIGHLDRMVLLGLATVGAIGFAWREMVTPDPAWQAARKALRFAKANPAMATVVGVIALSVIVQVLGGVGMMDRNAWDDDICYTPLVRRLIDRGDMIEPFAFRRMSSYGGQTVLHAMAAARGTLSNMNLVDKGLSEGLGLLLVASYARERRAKGLWTALAVLVVLWAPHIMLNTASYFSGLLVFVALYRSVVKERWFMVGLVSAAACTLRQNYLPVVALFVVLALAFRLHAAAKESSYKVAWKSGRGAWIAVIVPAAVAILPWMIASQLSNHTFLFPFIKGTYNSAITLVPETATWADEVALMLWAAVGPAPIIVVPFLVVVLAFVKDSRIHKPLVAMWIANIIGFLLLVHGFLSSDATNLWRYAFGYASTLVCMMTVELSGLEDGGEVRLPPVGRYLLLASLALQIIDSRGSIVGLYTQNAYDIKESTTMTYGDPTTRVETIRYSRMQDAIPEGAKTVLMVDDPWYLDYTRNDFANLDSPGFASERPGLPCFTTASTWHAYFKKLGFQYAAFVRSKKSRYFFRRLDWVHRLFADVEIFENMSAYTLDAVDTFEELSKEVPIVFEHDGLVVLDLRGEPKPVPAFDPSEAARRDVWVRAMAEREHLHGAWTLADRGNVRWHDGFTLVTFVDDSGEVIARGNDLNGFASRGMQRRSHVRLRGEGRDMHLVLKGTVALERVMAEPRLDISLDGNLLGSAPVDAEGKFELDAVVPKDLLPTGSWRDLYMLWSAMGVAEKDLHQLFIARLDSFEWEPAK